MKHLFLARHGEDDGRALSEEGKKQMETLAGKMAEIAVPSVLISSRADRTMQGARILAERFGLPEDKILEYDCYCDINPQHMSQYEVIALFSGMYDLTRLVREREAGADGIAIVTHGGFAETFRDFYLGKFLHVNLGLRDLGKGTAYDIDVEKKWCSFISGLTGEN